MRMNADRHIHSVQAEVEDFLRLREQDAQCRVLSVLGESAVEATQLIRLRGKLFVRKLIRADSGFGEIYGSLLSLQRNGACLDGVPRIESCHPISKSPAAEEPAGVPAGVWECVIMEYVEGETVSEAVCRRGASLGFAADLMPSVCDAVTGLHRAAGGPIIHRDLKPDNIIVSPRGAVLVDFGISRVYKEESERDTAMFGTRAYAPPEQFGFGQTDCRSDVYALGMLLCFCLTGEDPSPRLQREGFASVGCPEAVREVMVRACSLDPGARYPSVEEFKAAFCSACESCLLPRRSNRAESAGREGAAGCDAGRCAADGLVAGALPAEASAIGRMPLLSRIPRRAGAVWNACLLTAWTVFLLFAVASALSPAAGHGQAPLAIRLLESVGTASGFLAVCAFVLMDRRPLRERFPRLGGISVPASGLMAFGAWSLFVFALSMFESAAGFV